MVKYETNIISKKHYAKNLFSVIRGKGGHRYNPTCQEFAAALKSASVAKLSSAESGNCLQEQSIPLLAMSPPGQTTRAEPTASDGLVCNYEVAQQFFCH